MLPEMCTPAGTWILKRTRDWSFDLPAARRPFPPGRHSVGFFGLDRAVDGAHRHALRRRQRDDLDVGRDVASELDHDLCASRLGNDASPLTARNSSVAPAAMGSFVPVAISTAGVCAAVARAMTASTIDPQHDAHPATRVTHTWLHPRARIGSEKSTIGFDGRVGGVRISSGRDQSRPIRQPEEHGLHGLRARVEEIEAVLGERAAEIARRPRTWPRSGSDTARTSACSTRSSTSSSARYPRPNWASSRSWWRAARTRPARHPAGRADPSARPDSRRTPFAACSARSRRAIHPDLARDDRRETGVTR